MVNEGYKIDLLSIYEVKVCPKLNIENSLPVQVCTFRQGSQEVVSKRYQPYYSYYSNASEHTLGIDLYLQNSMKQ